MFLIILRHRTANFSLVLQMLYRRFRETVVVRPDPVGLSLLDLAYFTQISEAE